MSCNKRQKNKIDHEAFLAFYKNIFEQRRVSHSTEFNSKGDRGCLSQLIGIFK